ncbi:MAG TPA: Rrf2 family transcriptional regulator, partial [Anaerolineae bacterium]|nr:Rrf2 family transcriptional regulator [Anaerolineae bacterium]
VAKRQGVPLPFLTKIAADLARAGLLEASRGAGGGISLRRPPQDISMLDVLEALEGPVTLNRCVSTPDFCPHTDYCGLHEVWAEAQADLINRLRDTSFAQLAQRTRVLQERVGQVTGPLNHTVSQAVQT